MTKRVKNGSYNLYYSRSSLLSLLFPLFTQREDSALLFLCINRDCMGRARNLCLQRIAGIQLIRPLRLERRIRRIKMENVETLIIKAANEKDLTFAKIFNGKAYALMDVDWIGYFGTLDEVLEFLDVLENEE